MTTGHVFIATSLDGFIARKNGDIEWLISRDDPSEDHGYDDFIKDMDAIVMGRGTFEKACSFDSWLYSKFVIVLSEQLKTQNIPKHLIGKVEVWDLKPNEVMEQIRQKGWKRVYVDGGKVIQSFLREGLIEDIVLTQVPVLIGEGLPLFGLLKKDVPLVHLETRTFKSGLVQSHYRIDN